MFPNSNLDPAKIEEAGCLIGALPLGVGLLKDNIGRHVTNEGAVIQILNAIICRQLHPTCFALCGGKNQLRHRQTIELLSHKEHCCWFSHHLGCIINFSII